MFTLFIVCATHCSLLRPIVIVHSYPTEEICTWSGEMMLQYIPDHDNLKIRCAK